MGFESLLCPALDGLDGGLHLLDGQSDAVVLEVEEAPDFELDEFGL